MHCSRRDSRGRYCWIVLVETWQMPDNDPQGVRKAIRLGREKSVTFICPDAVESSIRVRLLFDSRGNCYAPRTTNKSKQQWLGERYWIPQWGNARNPSISISIHDTYVHTYVARGKEKRKKTHVCLLDGRTCVRPSRPVRLSLSLSPTIINPEWTSQG